MKDSKKLQEKLSLLVKNLRPYGAEKIILYGSYARGDYRKESDFDLLIVKKTSKPRHKRIGEVLNFLYPKTGLDVDNYGASVEPVVYTPRELEERIRLGDFFIQEVLSQGRVLYEAG